MLFPHLVTDLVGKAVRWADRQIRAELRDGYIATENDYTSNFTGTIRRQINGYDCPGLLAQSFVLKPCVERKVGADACIIFANKNEFKVGIFEAKWPRLSTNKDSWDSLQTSNGLSHFDTQLIRQSLFGTHFAIWEMFYMEHPFGKQPAGFPDHNSGCIWHSNAYAASNKRTKTAPWRDAELLSIGPVHEIDRIVKEICECRAGTAIPGDDYMHVFRDMLDAPITALLIKYDGVVGTEAIG